MTKNSDIKENRKLSVVTATNLNPKYLNCVPIFVKFWRQMNEIQNEVEFIPEILLIITENQEIPRILKNLSEVKIIQITNNDMNTAFMAQNIRTIATIDSKAAYAMTTDIDMVPLNPFYFIEALDFTIKHDSSLTLFEEKIENQFRICYIMGSVQVWRQIYPNKKTLWHLQDSIEIFRSRNEQYVGIHGGSGWHFDQEIIYEKVIQSGVLWNYFTSKTREFFRLDRIYNGRIFSKDFVSGKMIDYHLVHPVARYTKLNNLVFKLNESYVNSKRNNLQNLIVRAIIISLLMRRDVRKKFREKMRFNEC